MATTTASDEIIIHSVGDVSPRRIDYGEPPESLFAMVAGRIKEADISVCQLECNLSTKGWLQYRSRPTTWYGRAHPDNVKSLVHGGFSLVTHASNHCFDYGPDSIVETVEVLRRNGIEVIGVGRNIEEARRPAIFERKGTKVAFLDYNSVLPEEYQAREDKPGCAPLKIATYYETQEFEPGTPPKVITIPREDDLKAMEDDIRRARAQADVVVMSIHWGVHFIPGVLADYQFTVGHRAIDAGADLILGSHPHLLKGIEIYKGKVIFFSQGNFAQETPHHIKPPPGILPRRMSKIYRSGENEFGTDRYGGPHDKQYTMMIKCVISGKRISKVSFFPGWVNDRAEPRLLSRDDSKFNEVLSYIERWCRPLGTSLTVEGDEVMVYPQRRAD